MLIIDFETRSRCDLFKRGAYNYALDPSTDILHCAFLPQDPDDDREFLWTPQDGPLPAEVVELIKSADYIVAHNAQFDRLIWSEIAVPDYGFPEIEFDHWYCSSAQCRVNGLPAGLADAARALDTRHKKDPRGDQLIKLLSLPQKDGTFNEDPDLMVEMGEYCLQDTRTTKAVMNATRLMTRTEHEDWLISEDINERGVMIDTAMAQATQRHANDELIEIAERLNEASHGAITKHTQYVRAAEWVLARLRETSEDHPAIKMMERYKEDELKFSLDKNAREDIIDAVDHGLFEVPDDVLDVVVAMNEGSASSVAKFKNMLLRADDETHRVYGAFIYGGASATMRFSSRGLQMHNLPSKGLGDEEETWDLYDTLMSGADLPKPVMKSLKKLLRHAIMADEDKALIIGDWTGIEARSLPWLADTEMATAKLDMIASGVDIYSVTAAEIGFSGNRPIGKVCELALGYEGGKGAFKQFAKLYGVVIEDGRIKPIIDKWRHTNSWVVQFWRDLEKAAMSAVRDPQTVYSAGRIRYLYSPALMGGSLMCILPDDSVLTYPKTRIETEKGRYKLTALKSSTKMKSGAKEWPRESLYGGRLAGHANQGTAAALLRDLLSRVDACIAHVHDEVILEVPDVVAEGSRDALEKEMTTTPAWAKGLPLNAKPIISYRYLKE